MSKMQNLKDLKNHRAQVLPVCGLSVLYLPPQRKSNFVQHLHRFIRPELNSELALVPPL
ncbi:hypothetical protein J6590_105510 [Homalodisca vitripennis]|nr:hypothetical protein J6590_105510 [Homalodisca vitripennis]